MESLSSHELRTAEGLNQLEVGRTVGKHWHGILNEQRHPVVRECCLPGNLWWRLWFGFK